MGRIVGRKRATLKGKQQQQQQQDGASVDGSQSATPAAASETVHRRNVHLFAQPVILAFHVVRFLAFQLWLLLSLVYRVGSNVVVSTRPQRDPAAQTAGQCVCVCVCLCVASAGFSLAVPASVTCVS